MNIIENIKSLIKEYKLYKKPMFSSALVPMNEKKRNIFKYIGLKNFAKKYGNDLYKHFIIMDDMKVYQFLINLFGKKNIEKALNNKEATTAQIADILFELGNVDFSSIDEKNYVLRNMMNCISFNRATGLYLSEFKFEANPESFKRKNCKSILDIFEENEITKEILKEIYDIYGKEIISEYNNDSNLRNATILNSDGRQDHVTFYSEEDFDLIFQKYFYNKEMSKKEKNILIGLFVKEADLIDLYTINHLREHSEYIKSEIEVGIFNDIVVNGKIYSNDERKRRTALSKVWSKEDFERYNNLELLKTRLGMLPQTQNIVYSINIIDEILSKPLNEIKNSGREISELMDSIFMEYEVENRNQIIENIYDPKNEKNIIISDLSQMKPAMLHFFNPDKQILSFDKYVEDLEKKRSKESGREFKFTEEEKNAIFLQYEAKRNAYITDYALESDFIGQVDGFSTQYITNVSNQLSTMVVTPDEICKGNAIRGNLALGFCKQTLNPELISTISSKNIYANKGIDYVESDNYFRDFSVSYDELISNEKRFGDNTEVVLFRNSYQSSLKPSYVMYIANDKMDSVAERENIELIKKQMKQTGLDVPLVIFDRYSINEKMKVAEPDKNQNANIEVR